MKALIIGAEGNIGSKLAPYLRSVGYEVLTTDIQPGFHKDYVVADINSPIDMLQLFDWKPDFVFLLSAIVSRVICEQSAGIAINTNLGGVNNILQLTKKVNAKLIFFSTSEIYGPNCEVMNESILNPQPNNRYGLTKLLGEKLVEYEVEQYGLKAVTLRPFMIYDEDEDFGDHRSAMIRFAYNLHSNIPVEIHKGSSRGWLHISDAVRAIEAATRVEKYMPINIGNLEIATIENLAHSICAELNADKKNIHITELPNRMTLMKYPTLERQTTFLKMIPQVSLREGIKRVCQKVKDRCSYK